VFALILIAGYAGVGRHAWIGAAVILIVLVALNCAVRSARRWCRHHL
jgi:hypothetical protein